MPTVPYVVLELSRWQLGACIVVTMASITLAYVIGLAEGRLREACEPTKQVFEDESDSLRGSGHGE